MACTAKIGTCDQGIGLGGTECTGMIARCGKDHRIGKLIDPCINRKGKGTIPFNGIGVGCGMAHHATDAFRFGI